MFNQLLSQRVSFPDCLVRSDLGMIYSEKTKKALKLCFEAHKNQTDKSGLPYVFHPFHLAEQMEDEDTTIVALLHDVVEDTDYTLTSARWGLGKLSLRHLRSCSMMMLCHTWTM